MTHVLVDLVTMPPLRGAPWWSHWWVTSVCYPFAVLESLHDDALAESCMGSGYRFEPVLVKDTAEEMAQALIDVAAGLSKTAAVSPEKGPEPRS